MATFVNRTCNSLEGGLTVWEGLGSKEVPLMTEIHIFLFSFFPPNRSDKEWELCTTESPTPVFKRFGGKGRAIDGRNIYFLFSYFFSKHEWHLWWQILRYTWAIVQGRTQGGGPKGALPPPPLHPNLHRQAQTKVVKIELSTKQPLVGPKHWPLMGACAWF